MGIFSQSGGWPPITKEKLEQFTEDLKKESFISKAEKDTKTTTFTKKPKENIIKDKFYSEEDVENWLLSKPGIPENKFVCLILGGDGTGKSPLALSYLSDKDVKEGKRVIVIDLDGGVIPLLNKYHKKRCEDLGRELEDVFIVKNPLTEKFAEGNVEIDYKNTFNKIRGVVKLLKKDGWIDKHKIKYMVFDGLSTGLKIAEYQMRLDRNLTADGGVSLRYWLIRNKLFIETLDSIKALPISCFFIAHEDFILSEKGDNSSVKIKTSATVHQKIRVMKTKDSSGKTIFKATIEKSKYNILNEGKEIIFGEVDTKNNKYTFTPKKVLEGLIWVLKPKNLNISNNIR